MSRPLHPMKSLNKIRAFSLVEVVVAVGVFAAVVVVVVGMLGPLSRSVTDVGEVDDASRLAATLQEGLQAEARRVGWTTFAGYLNGGTTLYANREGTRVGPGNVVAIWDVDNSGAVTTTDDGYKFFSITLNRNTALSPNAVPNLDADAGYLAFTIRLAWPAYRPDGTQVQNDGLTQQSILILPAAVVR